MDDTIWYITKNSSLGYIVVGYWTTHGCHGSSSCSFNAWDFKLLAWEHKMDPECIDVTLNTWNLLGLLQLTLWIRPGSVLKPKPRFWGKPNQNRKLGFDRGRSRFWGRTRLTEDVVHSLNDVVFKLFLTGLLNDSQCKVGGRTWESALSASFRSC